MMLRRFLQRLKQHQWGAIATELVIVIIGVFIGIQVSNWNEERGTQRKAAVFTARLTEDLRKEGQKILKDCRQQALDAGVPVDVVMEEGTRGRLAELVQEQVRSWPADVVVLGTHGRRGVGRMVLGSDAEQVVRSCPVPVLLVRGTDALPIG